MYKKYRACPPPVKTIITGPCCPLPVQPGRDTIPESMRMISQQCPYACVTTLVTPLCNNNGTTANTVTSEPQLFTSATVQKRLVPVNSNTPIPFVDVGTTPASVTTRQQTLTALSQSSNPYNPTTRFNQYFPPQPPPAPCPIRMPSNEPKISIPVCVPVTRFKGSSVNE